MERRGATSAQTTRQIAWREKKCFRKSPTNSYFRGVYRARTRLRHASVCPARHEENEVEDRRGRQRKRERERTKRSPSLKSLRNVPPYFHEQVPRVVSAYAGCRAWCSFIHGFRDAQGGPRRCKRSCRIEFTKCAFAL